jgi:signal transduction histidine kinase
MRPRSLTGRLMLAAMAGVLAAAVVTVTLTSLLVWPRSPARLLRGELEEEVEHVRDGLRVDATGRVRVVFEDRTTNTYEAMPRDAAYLVRDASGQVVASSDEGPALQALKTLPPQAQTLLVPDRRAGVRLQVTERAITQAGRRYVIRVARSDRLVTTLNDYAGELYLRAGTLTVLLALATFALVVFLTIQRLVRPLRRTSLAASRIGPRNLGTRLRSDHLPSELVPLIEAFNAALARLETGFRVQQEFLASAAHELKTPLALLQAEIELDGVANKTLLLRDTALMARQVHQLLQLAEVSEGHNYQFAPISLPAAVTGAVEYMTRLADQHDVRLEVQRASGIEAGIEADAAAVFVLVKNLLENAIHHAPANSVVLVQLSRHGFSVEDQGPGVAAPDRARLFERFWRGAAREGDGAGLGLAICREICVAHGWTIALDTTTQARGARLVVTLDPAGDAT